MTTVFGLERQRPLMNEDEGTLSVDELVEYCRTQAGLLSGRTETIGAEADALLDEIDADIAELRSRLATHGSEAATTSASATGPDEGDVAELEELERDLEEKQSIAEAKQARMAAFQELAVAYSELAEELAGTDDGRAALERVVEFEQEHDAPAYFDERETLLETVAAANE